jgi:hypothetical protein
MWVARFPSSSLSETSLRSTRSGSSVSPARLLFGMAGIGTHGRGSFPAVAATAAMATGLFLLSASAAALLSPALIFLLILSLGLRPGEQLIERAHSRRARSRGRRRPILVAVPLVLQLAHCVGRKLAFALAMRPPPLTLLPAS